MNSRGRQILVERAVVAVALLFFAHGVAGQTTGPARAADPPRFTTDGRWKAENVLGAESILIQEVSRTILVGDDIFFWARGSGGKDDWRLFHLPAGGKARPLHAHNEEFTEPDGVKKKLLHAWRVESGARFREADRWNLAYIGCGRPRLRKFHICSEGGEVVGSIGNVDETVYALEGQGLRRLIGPGDLIDLGGRTATLKAAQIVSAGPAGALVRYEEQDSKARGIVLVDGKSIRPLVKDGGTVPGMPSAQIKNTLAYGARVYRDSMLLEVEMAGSPGGNVLLRLRGEVVERIVGNGDVVDGRVVAGFGQVTSDGETVAMIADTKDGPDRLLVHHNGRLSVGGDIQTWAVLRMVVLGGGRPDVVLTMRRDKSHKEYYLLHYDGRRLRELALGPLAELVRGVIKEHRNIEGYNYPLKPLPWTGEVAIGGPQTYRMEEGDKFEEDHSVWVLDLTGLAPIRRSRGFDAGAAGIFDLTDVVDWPRPEEVLLATKKGIYRLTRVPGSGAPS